MKFVISTNTINALNTKVKDEALALGASAEIVSQLTSSTEITHLKNLRIEQVDGNWEYELDDEALFLMLRMYVRIAKFIVPLIAPVVALMQGLKSDSETFDDFINAKK